MVNIVHLSDNVQKQWAFYIFHSGYSETNGFCHLPDEEPEFLAN